MIAHPSFAVEPWSLRETKLDLEVLAQTESVFALANGHIGMRANLDEGEPYAIPGTYLNSFYELRPLPYAEAGFGYPESGQTLVNVTNGKIIRLLVDDEPFDVRYGQLLAHDPVDPLLEQRFDAGRGQHLARVLARGHHCRFEARRAHGPDVADRALVDVHALPADRGQYELVLPVPQTGDRLGARWVGREARRDVDSACGQERPHAVLARLPVDILVVVVGRVERLERLPRSLRTRLQKVVEHLLPRRGVQRRRFGEHAVQIEEACSDRRR